MSCASSSCEKDDHLATVKTLESWQTLYEAARVRSHAPILELAKHLEGNKIPKILYHRKCRSIFTMKRDLETLKRKANDSLSEDAGASSSSKRLCKRSPWDNIDRLEETLTGKGTSHRVNGIVVQAKVFGPFLPRAELPHIEKKKQRSVSAEYQGLEVYVAGARAGPEPLPTRNVQEAEQVAKVALKKNLVWILARQMDQEHQAIPSWTGFNIRTRDQVSISEDVVEYLPTINAPATELSTVLEILNQSDCIRKKLLLETIVVVMDQALYAKASEIIWKQKELFPHILLRMGIFHTICNALSILGKRFQGAGLRDICIEAGIVAEGSISGELDGKHYNRAVRVHKCIYEALMRLAWTEFVVWVEDDHEASAMIKAFVEKVNSMA